MSSFQFGAHAIHAPESEARFNERRDSIIESIRPANIIELILTEELLHASWEMERVRDNSANTAAETHLNAAHTRASRNWQRSLKQLKNLQSDRASHFSQLYQTAERNLGETCPLADIGKLSKPFSIGFEATPEVQ